MGATEPPPVEQGSLPDGGLADYPAVSSTGDAAVDDVLHTLTAMPELAEADQHTAYEQLHDELLAELNTEHS
ncbi:hypothetical protein GCM10009784_24060 [Arthrobacter parietis]|uniref:Uncharacterized protein n=2 Tax=Arthrobacter TaxID=1663 RepID=A0ABT6CYE6_9MICC|nr:hypothetical protein [Arthrobacter vasquezii]MDF9279024.1 hypothetical protein [Arthrobacter vasquezii]